jgi:hypothetical protein
MITRSYPVTVSVLLNPVWFDRKPTGRIGVDDVEDFILDQPTWFNFQLSGEEEITKTLTIEHYGKTNQDTRIDTNEDTAIIVEEIKFNNIGSPKFAWAGVYQPNYPEHYRQGKTLEPTLSPYTYLGWNGVWTLEFTLPIYTWIHKIENFGWIHD